MPLPPMLTTTRAGALLRLSSILASLLFAALPAAAQWQQLPLTLRGGWNAVYLHGDADHATIDALLPDSGSTAAVREIWRWNPNPDQVGFTSSPLLPTAGTPEWTTWTRGAPNNALQRLTGQSAYLVFCTGTSTTTHAISFPYRPTPPQAEWVRNGANFLGFPARKTTGSPSLGAYFASFPAAFAANAKVFRYVGGPLSEVNPLLLFSPASEPLDRDQAYWFESGVVGNFTAPVQITLSRPEGLAFGRNGSVTTARVLNRTASAMTLRIAPVVSNAAPQGSEEIVGSVPVTRRVFSTQTASWQETLIQAQYEEVIGPGAAVELHFGIDRASMTGEDDLLFASMLRFTDAPGLFDILIPVTARKTSLAGLWLGDALVRGVESKAQEDAVTPVGRAFPLRILLHVDTSGEARLLSQVHLGTLAAPPHGLGIALHETGLKPDTLADAARITVAHLPLDRALGAGDGDGAMAIPGSLTRIVTVAHDDPTNPFVHQYHPDHDNRDARRNPLPAGFESYTIERRITFAFTSAPPSGSSVTSGWGSSVIGGTYSEVIEGLTKDSTGVGTGDGLHLEGTFELRRISELGEITLEP